MRMITQYFEPDAGAIRLDGHAPRPKPGRAAKRRIGYLPENNPLYDEMLVSEYLDFVGRLRTLRGAGTAGAAWTRRSPRRAVEQVYHRPIGELSKGFRQRVGLAAADPPPARPPGPGRADRRPRPQPASRDPTADRRARARAHRHPIDPRSARSAVHLLPAADHQSRSDRGRRPGGRADLSRQGRRARECRGLGSGRRRWPRGTARRHQGRAARGGR